MQASSSAQRRSLTMPGPGLAERDDLEFDGGMGRKVFKGADNTPCGLVESKLFARGAIV